MSFVFNIIINIIMSIWTFKVFMVCFGTALQQQHFCWKVKKSCGKILKFFSLKSTLGPKFLLAKINFLIFKKKIFSFCKKISPSIAPKALFYLIFTSKYIHIKNITEQFSLLLKQYFFYEHFFWHQFLTAVSDKALVRWELFNYLTCKKF